MPLLALEPFVHPEDIFAASVPVDGSEWLVLHTRPRDEKTLARKLFQGDCGFFLPLYKRQWRSRGRLQTSYLPLFPGYVFLRGDAAARLYALETNLLVGVLKDPDQEQLSEDLGRVFQMVQSGLALTPEQRLTPGTTVEIVKGPLAGLTGKVLRGGAKLRLIVEVRFLHQGVSVEIESWMLRAASPACC